MKKHRSILFLFIFCSAVFIKCTNNNSSRQSSQSQSNEFNSSKNISLPIIEGFKKGELLASEDFSGTLDNWMQEGKVSGYIDNGKLFFESLDPEIENPKGNIWWRVKIESPFVLEFDYRSLSDHGLSMIFWNAHGLDGNDVFSWKRTGKYEEYVNDNLHAYHVSFHRFGSGKSNIRKAPGFHLVSSVDDPIAMEDTDVHRIMITTAGNLQRVFVDGKLIHDFIDEGQPCLSKEEWQHKIPCTGTGDVPDIGAIGIRHTQKQQAYYDNFRIYRLSPVDSSGK